MDAHEYVPLVGARWMQGGEPIPAATSCRNSRRGEGGGGPPFDVKQGSLVAGRPHPHLHVAPVGHPCHPAGGAHNQEQPAVGGAAGRGQGGRHWGRGNQVGELSRVLQGALHLNGLSCCLGSCVSAATRCAPACVHTHNGALPAPQRGLLELGGVYDLVSEQAAALRVLWCCGLGSVPGQRACWPPGRAAGASQAQPATEPAAPLLLPFLSNMLASLRKRLQYVGHRKAAAL